VLDGEHVVAEGSSPGQFGRERSRGRVAGDLEEGRLINKKGEGRRGESKGLAGMRRREWRRGRNGTYIDVFPWRGSVGGHDAV
jgi:hypothetical protein